MKLSLLKEQLYPISLYSRQISGTVAILLLARYLPVFDYGLFSSYRAIAMFCLLFANIGYNEYILVSSQNIVKEVQLKIGFFIINAFIVIATIIVVSLFASLYSKIMFILVLLRTFFDNVFFLLILPYFQSSRKFRAISYINIIYSIAIISIAAISYYFKFSLTNFLYLSIFIGLMNFLQVSHYAKINYIFSIKHFKQLFKKLDKSIFSYIGVLLCSYLYGQLPALYCSLFVDKETAALFFAAFTIASIISLLLSAQTQKMIPEMINGTEEKVKSVIKSNQNLIMALNIITFLIFIFFGKDILKLLYFKDYFITAYPILIILTISNISISIAAIYGAFITASGNQHLKIKMQAEAIIISILTLILLYKFGIFAAAAAYFLSATHIGIRYVIKTKQLLRRTFDKEDICN